MSNATYFHRSVEDMIAEIEARASEHFQSAEAAEPYGKKTGRDNAVVAASHRARASAYRSIASQLRATLIGPTVAEATFLTELTRK